MLCVLLQCAYLANTHPFKSENDVNFLGPCIPKALNMLIYGEKYIGCHPNVVIRDSAMLGQAPALGHKCANLVKSNYFAYISVSVKFVLYLLEKRPINPII